MSLFLPNVAQLLVEALRSGEYPQTTGALNDSDGFCCLGVLCEVAIKNGVRVAKSEPDSAGVVSYDDERELPPVSVTRWATGRDTVNWEVPLVDDDGLVTTAELVELNDSSMWTFDKIAKAIEDDQQNTRP